MRSVIFAIFLLGVAAAAQEAPQYGKWIRQVNTDQLTGETQIMYEFLQQQPDGRIPSISFYCSNGKMENNSLTYFTGIELYEDVDAEMNSLGNPDLDVYSTDVHFRGPGRKVYHCFETVPAADRQRFSLKCGEMVSLGKGTLILRYTAYNGATITDTLRQDINPQSAYDQAFKDCYAKEWARLQKKSAKR